MGLLTTLRRAGLVGLVVLAGCSPLVLDLKAPPGEADWLTEGDAPGRTQAVGVRAEPPFELAWTYNAGAGFGPLSPLVVGDHVIVATRRGEVHLIDRATGKRRGLHRLGEAIEGTPLLHDRQLFVPLSWGRKALVAYDLANGRVRWAERQGDVQGGLLLSGETLVVAMFHGPVRGLEPRSGEPRWTYAWPDAMSARHVTPVEAAPGVAVVVDDAGLVVALESATGAVRWRRALEAPVHATPAAAGGLLYVATTAGRLVALDATTGAERWRLQLANAAVRLTAPAVDGGTVYVGGTDGVLRALEAATGTERWAFQAPEVIAAPPLLTETLVFAASMGERLYALDRADGTVRWQTEVRGRVKSAMAYRDGLLVLSEPRYVSYYKPAQTHAPAP